MRSGWDLSALLTAADPAASRVVRNLWLVRLMQWLRRPQRARDARLPEDEAASGPSAPRPGSTPLPVVRLRHLCGVLERNPAQRERVQAVVAALLADLDSMSLYADFGFAPRASFGSELVARIAGHLLPATPDTNSMARIFPLLFEQDDAAWIEQIDANTRSRLSVLFARVDRLQEGNELVDGLAQICHAIRTAGYSSALRLRMSPETLVHRPFAQLTVAMDALAEQLHRAADAAGRAHGSDTLAGVPNLAAQANVLRIVLAQCRSAVDSVAQHLDEFGVSIAIVFEIDQLRSRIDRAELLLETLLGEAASALSIAHEDSGATATRAGAGVAAAARDPAWHRLIAALVRAMGARRSVGALVGEQTTQLSRRVVDRNAQTGEHYIARTHDEFAQMLHAASGGGLILAITTLVKFAIGTLALSAFWMGLAAGLNYAVSFVVVMLAHYTVATKQPAMTAPAMAARLQEVRRDPGDEEHAMDRLVDEIAWLLRSQTAGIVGNVGMCFPIVLLLQMLATQYLGHPLIDTETATHTLHKLTLLGPTPLYAAFTGVLLFTSALIGGWAENAFVLHRLDSAIAWNPAIVDRMGSERARRWAHWWRNNVASLAANIALGLMLGLVPEIARFFGLPLDVRHVTLSTGQWAAALGTLGIDALSMPQFWWAAAGLVVTAVLNVGVSFWLAFRVAMRARGVRGTQRERIYRAIRQRMRRAPLSFLRPRPSS